MNRKLVSLAVVGLVIAAALGWGLNRPTPGVTVEVSEGASAQSLVFSGHVIEVLFREGDKVKAGEVMARLDGQRELAQPTSQANLALAQANLDAALSDEKRSQDLLAKGFVSQAKIMTCLLNGSSAPVVEQTSSLIRVA